MNVEAGARTWNARSAVAGIFKGIGGPVLFIVTALLYTVRITLFTFLAIFEPIVTLVLAGLTMLGLLTIVVFEASGVPNFPFWIMLTISLGWTVLLAAYYALMRVLAV